MLPGLVTFQVQLVSFDFVEDMPVPVTRIHSPGYLYDISNVATETQSRRPGAQSPAGETEK